MIYKSDIIIHDLSSSYSEEQVEVLFGVRDVVFAIKILRELSYMVSKDDSGFGKGVVLAMQQVPEVVRKHTNENIAMYAVAPLIW